MTLNLTAIAVHRGRVRKADWQRVSRGLYAPSGEADEDGRNHASLVSEVLPRDSGLGHLSSALVRRWWLPLGCHPKVVFGTTCSRVHVQRRGLYVRRSDYAEVELVDGVRLMTAPQTLIELARDLSLVDLVPLVDCALAAGCISDEVLNACRPKAYGAARLRRALTLADPKSESWWESVLRLQHTLTGLGPVEAQVEIWDGARFVARADLHLVGTNRYPECDGGEHRTPARQANDLGRDRRMSALRLERYGYTTTEIARHPEVVIRDAELARGLDADPARLTHWWQEARSSSLTAYGRTRLAARLERYRLAGLPRRTQLSTPGELRHP